MKLIIISDTHMHDLTQMNLPPGDLLIHCGDLSHQGTIPELTKVNHELMFIKDRYKHGILICPGNHDFLFEWNMSLAKDIMQSARVLHDEAIDIEGIKFYSTAWQPYFFDWAFNVKESDQLAEKYKHIPDDTQVLITHCPPLNILDLAVNRFNPNGKNVGSLELLDRVRELKKLKLHCFGHIHYSAGSVEIDGVKYVNGCTCNERYEKANPPIVIDLIV